MFSVGREWQPGKCDASTFPRAAQPWFPTQGMRDSYYLVIMLNTAQWGELRRKDEIRALSSSSREREQKSFTLVCQSAELFTRI